MRKVKKWFGKISVFLLAAILALSFGACSSKGDKAADSTAETAIQSAGETAVSSGENESASAAAKGESSTKAGETTAKTAASGKSAKGSEANKKSSASSKSSSSSSKSGSESSATTKKSSSSSSKTTKKQSTTKKTTTTKKRTTEKKTTKAKSYAMSASEIRSYALSQIKKINGTIYTPEFTKGNAGWNTPLVVYPGDSASEIKEGCRSYAKFNYNSTTKNGYNVYVENSKDINGNKCMKVYFLYGQMGGPDEY